MRHQLYAEVAEDRQAVPGLTEPGGQRGVTAHMTATLLAALTLSALPPTTQPPTADQIQAAARVSAEARGFAFLVMHEGKVIFEAYPNGGSASRATELASGTKSFAGVMALAAQEDGLLKLDESVSDTLSEWRDPDRKNITIRELLTLTSGVPGAHPTVGPQRPGRPSAQRVPSYAEAILAKPSAAPGTRFQYGATPFMVFGEVMRRKLQPTGEGVLAYLERRVFAPIELKVGRWRRDRDGNLHLPSGAALTAREWAKFGEMIRLNGKGVLRESSVAELWKGTRARPSYGLTWWLPAEGPVGAGLPRSAGTDLPKDIRMAAGAGGQRLWVIPSRGLTIVRLAPVLGERTPFDDRTILTPLLASKS